MLVHFLLTNLPSTVDSVGACRCLVLMSAVIDLIDVVLHALMYCNCICKLWLVLCCWMFISNSCCAWYQSFESCTGMSNVKLEVVWDGCLMHGQSLLIAVDAVCIVMQLLSMCTDTLPWQILRELLRFEVVSFEMIVFELTVSVHLALVTIALKYHSCVHCVHVAFVLLGMIAHVLSCCLVHLFEIEIQVSWPWKVV